MRRSRVIFVVLALVVAACAGGTERREEKTTKEAATGAGEGPQTIPVQVDGHTPEFNGVFTAFFPNEVSAHPGDRVAFKMPKFPGDPHTVTLGTLVDSAMAKLKELGPSVSQNDQEETPEMRNLPGIFPTAPPAGPPDANQSAAQPCFLDSGVPPLSPSGSAPACPRRTQPEFNGRQSFYNSGALFNDGDSFDVKLADDVRPGTYSVICLVHRGFMTGSINVVPNSQPVPDPDEAMRRGQQQLADMVQRLRPAAAQLETGTASKAFVGAGVPDPQNPFLVAEFGPKELPARTGETVTWDVSYFHSISFNVPQDAIGVLIKGPDGAVHLNPKAGAPSQNPPGPPPVEPPPPDAKPTTVDGGAWDGTGFKSTGLFGSIPPALVTYKLTFTKPGTYQLQCVLHPDMKGTVKVT